MTITTQLVIARHGQARCNVDGRVGGPKTCTGLTDLGRMQTEQLAVRLAAQHSTGKAFDALYAGPRLRLRESGQILAAALGLSLITDPGLDGPRHGQADGQLWYDVETAFHGAPHTHPDQPYAPGSDTWNSYLRRATVHLAALLERHQGQTILLAAHGETIHAACRLLLGLGPQTSSRAGFGTDHASLTRFEHDRDRFGQSTWILAALNDTAHLHSPNA
ncbi:histidine phosphatase family protein [Streptomyces lunaelactis]|uniref:histidine phosphatase family protein n=1 Tax=Streptomyces lunaelactis TaxID=1535768 RepID=UPI00158567B5|nr:histidine phosphatase family protein [Streptomyces lunaelactis]NUL04761.1 histidine phosphatase family protein [Streptomyces lunaelactis]